MNIDNLKRRAVLMLHHMGNMHLATFKLYDLYAQSQPFSFSEDEAISVVTDILKGDSYGLSGRVQLEPKTLRFFSEYLKGITEEERTILSALASYYEHKANLDGLSAYTVERYIKKRNKRHNNSWDSELILFTEGTAEFYSYMGCFQVREHILALFQDFPRLQYFISRNPQAAELILSGEFTLQEYHEDIINFHKSRNFEPVEIDPSLFDYYPEGCLPTTGGYYLPNPEGVRWFVSFPSSCTNLRSETIDLPYHLGLSGFFTVEPTNHIHIPQCGISVALHPEISVPCPADTEVVELSSLDDLYHSDTDLVCYPVPALFPLKDYI